MSGGPGVVLMPMKFFLGWYSYCLGWLVPACLASGILAAELREPFPGREPDPATNSPPIELPRMTVVARREPMFDPLAVVERKPNLGDWSRAQDGAALLRDVPGATVVRNGPQTGIPQLRGLSGDRVRVAIDGMTITPACPNHMDPPLHYAAPTSVDALAVMAGITPVSQGGDSLAGTVLVESTPPLFATNRGILPFGEATVIARTGNDGLALSGRGGAATRHFSLNYQGGWNTAADYRFPGGRVRDTGFDTQHHRILFGAQSTSGGLAADVGWLRTRDAGTPALPMDMIRDDAFHAGLDAEQEFAFGTLEARLYHHTIDHWMDNYSLRPAGPNRMFSPATSDDTGLRLDATFPRDRHQFGVGIESLFNRFDAYQQNATTGRQQDTLKNAARDRLGAYAEWHAEWSGLWQTLVGLRSDTLWSDTDNVDSFFPASAADRTAFNARAHAETEANLDATIALRFRPDSHQTYELGFARKNRAPSLLERYLWTPLSASAGQADGRTYLGSLDLDSETSHQVALTADWHGTNWQFQVTPFYQHVADYIQGTPISRLDPNGRSVLQFQNLDAAELYGIEAQTSYDPTGWLTLRGLLSYVRGRNLETDDNLYRIAPLRGLLALDARYGITEGTVEVVLVNHQEEVAAYNAEPPSPGYALLNLRTGFRFNPYLHLELSLENVLDEDYADHLGGINRVSGSDVAVGQRLPGMGRSLVLALNARF